MAVSTEHHAATFQIDDPDALVEASFACPCCLHATCRVALGDGEGPREARCRCTRCAFGWIVELDPRQLLRLSLDPPPAIWLRPGGGARQLEGLWPYGDEEPGADG